MFKCFHFNTHQIDWLDALSVCALLFQFIFCWNEFPIYSCWINGTCVHKIFICVKQQNVKDSLTLLLKTETMARLRLQEHWICKSLLSSCMDRKLLNGKFFENSKSLCNYEIFRSRKWIYSKCLFEKERASDFLGFFPSVVQISGQIFKFRM